MATDKIGQIVWHDLFTADRPRSMAFYKGLADWQYAIEHATDFAWGGGQKDFVLALGGGEAGAGFAETPPGFENGWIAYVEVGDVDAAATLAETLGGTVLRPPFEVPGVGRNALIGDPLGAVIGLSLSRHGFPAPRRQFGQELYLTDGTPFPETFYAKLFDWHVKPSIGDGQAAEIISGHSDEIIALYLDGGDLWGSPARWIPSVKVADPATAYDSALKLGAAAIAPEALGSAKRAYRLLLDPLGSWFGLVDAG